MKNDVVIINLDRPRELRFGHKAIKTLLAMTGKDLESLEIGENMNLEELEKILYCGLLSDAKENSETLRVEDMEDLLDQAESFSEITQKMTEAMQKAFGSAGTESGNGPAQPTK